MTRSAIMALATAACLIGGMSASAADPAGSDFFCSMYTDTRATSVGDIVLVVISESTLASHSATRGNEKSSATTAGPGTGWLDFIPLAGYSGQSKSKATGTSPHRSSGFPTTAPWTPTGCRFRFWRII